MNELSNLQVINNRFLHVTNINTDEQLFINVDLINTIIKSEIMDNVYKIYFIDKNEMPLTVEPII